MPPAAAGTATMDLRPGYLLRARLDWDAGSLLVAETVSITNASPSAISYVDFSVPAHNWGEMSLASVAVDGLAVAPWFSDPANLRVPFSAPLAPAAGATIVIEFNAIASSDTSDSLTSRLSRAGGIMQVSAWYPVLSDGHGVRHPGDAQFTVAADYRLELTHPPGMVIAAPGDLVSSSATTKVYVLHDARELAFAASPDFVVESTTSAGGVEVVTYHLAGVAGAARSPAVAAAALDAFGDLLGAYPYRRFVVAQGTRARTGVEYSGIVFIGSAALRSREVITHEVAHQWWYGIVGNDQLNEPWLDESFAEFTGHWLTGTPVPAPCSTRPVNSSIYEFPELPARTTLHDCESYDQTIYFRGAYFLDGIRRRMGDAAFFGALRALVSENRFGVVGGDIVRATLMRHADDPDGLARYLDLYLS